MANKGYNQGVLNRYKSFIIIGIMILCLLVITKIAEMPYLPSLDKIIKSMADELINMELVRHSYSSIITIMAGYIISIIICAILIILSEANNAFKKTISMVADYLRSVAAIAIAPLFIIMLGIGIETRVAIIVWIAWSPLYISTITSTGLIDRCIIDASKLDGANKWEILFKIKIPLSAKQIIAGLRISMGSCWIGLIAAEMIASNEGLGYYILIKSSVFEIPAMYAGILITGMLGYIFNRILYFIQRRIDI